MKYTNIQLTLPVEVVQALRRAAQTQGISVHAYVQALLAAKLGTPLPNPVDFNAAVPSDMGELERVPQEGETPEEAKAADDQVAFIKKITGH